MSGSVAVPAKTRATNVACTSMSGKGTTECETPRKESDGSL